MSSCSSLCFCCLLCYCLSLHPQHFLVLLCFGSLRWLRMIIWFQTHTNWISWYLYLKKKFFFSSNIHVILFSVFGCPFLWAFVFIDRGNIGHLLVFFLHYWEILTTSTSHAPLLNFFYICCIISIISLYAWSQRSYCILTIWLRKLTI